MENNQFEDLDLDDEKKTSTKSYVNRIARLDTKAARALRELNMAQEKAESSEIAINS